MNPRELVDHIRNGPAELVLDEPLVSAVERSNPCDFNEFCKHCSLVETPELRCVVAPVIGYHRRRVGLLVQALGSIKVLKLYRFAAALALTVTNLSRQSPKR
jgi:hypothetical protein